MARLGISQQIRQGMQQEMQLLPRMLQSIEVLQLPSLELEAYLHHAIQENVTLTLEVPGPSQLEGPRPRRGSWEESESHGAWLENQPDSAPGLEEAVLGQLPWGDIEQELEPWVRLVAGSLDAAGCLAVSDERLLEMAGEAGLGEDAGALGRAIAVVQAVEPRGIGGRDLVETLLLQLSPDDPDYGELCRLLEEFLEDVAKNKLPAVARSMGLEIDELNRLLGRLRELDPSPGRRLGGESQPPIRPEVLVRPKDEGYEILIDQSGLPALSIDEGVAQLARDREQAADVRRYLREKLEQARWVMDAVEQRRRTLQRIAVYVFNHQRPFLDEGPGHLSPLRMTAVAEELDLHVSTVSRAVSGKFAETPWGTFPLRHFFQAAAGGDEGTAREDVREVVRRVFAEEDPRAPLSDDEVVEALGAQGVKLARRTVAKYRKELGIPSSYRRRKY